MTLFESIMKCNYFSFHILKSFALGKSPDMRMSKWWQNVISGWYVHIRWVLFLYFMVVVIIECVVRWKANYLTLGAMLNNFNNYLSSCWQQRDRIKVLDLFLTPLESNFRNLQALNLIKQIKFWLNEHELIYKHHQFINIYLAALGCLC